MPILIPSSADPDPEELTKSIKVWLTPSVKDDLESAAKAARTTVSAYVRRLIHDDIRKD